MRRAVLDCTGKVKKPENKSGNKGANYGPRAPYEGLEQKLFSITRNFYYYIPPNFFFLK